MSYILREKPGFGCFRLRYRGHSALPSASGRRQPFQGLPHGEAGVQKATEDNEDDPDIVVDFGDGPRVFRRSFLFEILKDMHQKQHASATRQVTVDTGQHLSAKSPPSDTFSSVPRDSVSEMDIVTLSDTSTDDINDLDAFDLIKSKPLQTSSPASSAGNTGKSSVGGAGNLFLQKPVARLYEATFGKESASSVPFKKRSQVREPVFTHPVFGQHVVSRPAEYQSQQSMGEDSVFIPCASDAALPGGSDSRKSMKSSQLSDSGKTKSKKVSRKSGSVGKEKAKTTGKGGEPVKGRKAPRGESPSKKGKCKKTKDRRDKVKKRDVCGDKSVQASPNSQGRKSKKAVETPGLSKNSGANINGLGENLPEAGENSEEGDPLSLISDSDSDISQSIIDEGHKSQPGGKKRSFSPLPTDSQPGVSGEKNSKPRGKTASKALKQEVKVVLEAMDLGESGSTPHIDINVGPLTPNLARKCRKQKQKAQAAMARAARAAKRARLSSSCSDIFAPSDGESPEAEKGDTDYQPPTRDRYPSIMGFGNVGGPVLLGTRAQPVAGRTRKRSK